MKNTKSPMREILYKQLNHIRELIPVGKTCPEKFTGIVIDREIWLLSFQHC